LLEPPLSGADDRLLSSAAASTLKPAGPPTSMVYPIELPIASAAAL
jgi:hypothetical protein